MSLWLILPLYDFAETDVIELDRKLTPIDLLPKLDRFWSRSAECIEAVERSCPPGSASPVFTVKGRYTSKGWTE